MPSPQERPAADRKEVEREFHNRLREVADDPGVTSTHWSPDLEETIRNNPLWVNMKYYSIERKSRDFTLEWLKSNVPGKKVLDLCCGNGADSIAMAEYGAAEVVGVDISDVSIENCRAQAAQAGVAGQVRFEVGDAEALPFAADSFDVIHEYGSLHHIDLAKTLPEMARVLKPGGKAIGDETLGHNPVIRWYRRATPHLRTPWEVEHILRKPQFEMMKEYFGRVDMRFYHMFTLLGVPFRRLVGFGALLTVLEGIDELVLRVPGLRWHAWQTVFVLSEPRK